MVTTFRRLLLAVGVMLAGLTPAFAQTTLNSTSLTAAVTATQQVIPLTSVTNIAVRDLVFVDREGMRVNAVDTVALNVTVTRGQQGTGARAHANASVAWTGPYQRFYLNDVIGTCTATAEQFLPHIVLPSGNVYQCHSSEWVLWRDAGFRSFEIGRTDGGTSYSASGAIAVQPGLSLITAAGVGTMTLAAPTVEQNGMLMMIYSTTAQAHTITVTAGFGPAGGAARDLGTFAAAIGNGLTLMAANGLWIVLSNLGVTLS